MVTRKEKSSSPELTPEKHKMVKTGTHVPDVSVLRAEQLRKTAEAVCSSSYLSTPVSRKTTTDNLVSKCLYLGINGSPVKLDLEQLHSFFVELELRVSKQEDDMLILKDELNKKDEQIFSLRRDNADLHKQFSDARADSISANSIAENEIVDTHTGAEFIGAAKRELPVLSQAVADLETSHAKMKKDIEQLTTDSGALNHDMEEQVNAIYARIDGINNPAPRTGVEGSVMETNQTGQVNLVAMDNELRRVGGEINNVNDRAKKHSRRAHLSGDQRDQYSRREILRVTGVPFKHGENTNQIMIQIAYSLGVQITDADISVSHRSGRRGGASPRPILCKFIRRDLKNHILGNKKLARNIRTDPDGNPVRIYVDEDLTKMRANVCKKLRQDKVPHYTRDGKVYIAAPSTEIEFKVFDTPDDWEQLQWLDSVKTEVGVYPRD